MLDAIGSIIASSFIGSLSGDADAVTKSCRFNPYVYEWHGSTDEQNRLYIGTNDRTYFGSQNGYERRSS